MKMHLLPLATVCAVLGAGSISAFADKVPPGQVPKAVLKGIKEQIQVHGEPAQDIERETKDGKVVYDVEFVKEGVNNHIKFNEDGTLWADDGDSAKAATLPAPGKLPAPVQKTLEQNRAGRTIAEWDEENWKEKTAYEIEFKEKGPNSRLYIASDGSVLGNKPGFKGLAFSETPKVVQDKVKEVAGDAEVTRITDKKKDGRVLYKVDLRQKGEDRRLVIANNGALVRDSEARNTSPEGATGRVRENITDAFADKTVSLNQTPNAVQKTIQNSSGAGTLKSIKQEQTDGKTVYNVEFEKSGRNSHLKIAEDGLILEDKRR